MTDKDNTWDFGLDHGNGGDEDVDTLIQRMLALERDKLKLQFEQGNLSKPKLRAQIIKLGEDITILRTSAEPATSRKEESSPVQSAPSSWDQDRSARMSTESSLSDSSSRVSTDPPVSRRLDAAMTSADGITGPDIQPQEDPQPRRPSKSTSGKYAPLITMPHALNYAVTLREKNPGGSRHNSVSIDSAGPSTRFNSMSGLESPTTREVGSRDRRSSILAVQFKYRDSAASVQSSNSNDAMSDAAGDSMDVESVSSKSGDSAAEPAASTSMLQNMRSESTSGMFSSEELALQLTQRRIGEHILEFCMIEANWSILREASMPISPLIQPSMVFQYPALSANDPSSNTQQMQEQSFFFPSGVKIELVPYGVMDVKLRPYNNKRHIVPFTDRNGHPLYACCLTVTQAYRVEDVNRLDAQIIRNLVRNYKAKYAAQCIQKAYRHHVAYRKCKLWNQVEVSQSPVVETSHIRSAGSFFHRTASSTRPMSTVISTSSPAKSSFFGGSSTSSHNNTNSSYAGAPVAVAHEMDGSVHGKSSTGSVNGQQPPQKTSIFSRFFRSSNNAPTPSATDHHAPAADNSNNGAASASTPAPPTAPAVAPQRRSFFSSGVATPVSANASAAATPPSLPSAAAVLAATPTTISTVSAVPVDTTTTTTSTSTASSNVATPVNASTTSALDAAVAVPVATPDMNTPSTEAATSLLVLSTNEQPPALRPTQDEASAPVTANATPVQQQQPAQPPQAPVAELKPWERPSSPLPPKVTSRFDIESDSTFLLDKVVVGQRCYCVISPLPEYTFIFTVLDAIAASETRRFSLYEEGHIAAVTTPSHASSLHDHFDHYPVDAAAEAHLPMEHTTTILAPILSEGDAAALLDKRCKYLHSVAEYMRQQFWKPPASHVQDLAMNFAVSQDAQSLYSRNRVLERLALRRSKRPTATAPLLRSAASFTSTSTSNAATAASAAASQHLHKYPLRYRDYGKVSAKDLSTLLSTTEWSLGVLLLHLNAQTVFKIVNLLLMEKSLIIYGRHAGVVTAITLGVAQLLSPFLWEGIFIPLVPDNARELFGAPVPLIIGTTSPPRLSDVSPATAVLHLNDDTALARFHNGRAATDAMSAASAVAALQDPSSLSSSSSSNKLARLKEIEFLAWFVRLPEVIADLPVNEEIAKRIEHTRRLLGQHVKDSLHILFQLPQQQRISRSYSRSASAKESSSPLLSNRLSLGQQPQVHHVHLPEETVTVKNQTDRILMAQVPSAIRQQLRTLSATLKRYNATMCGHDIDDVSQWKRFVRLNSVTQTDEFFPESFMEPLRGKLEFQEAMVNTQLFVSFIDRLRREQKVLDHVREFIGHWIYCRVVMRRSHRRRQGKVRMKSFRRPAPSSPTTTS